MPHPILPGNRLAPPQGPPLGGHNMAAAPDRFVGRQAVPVGNLATREAVNNGSSRGEARPDYPVQYRTFEAARKHVSVYSDGFIDRALTDTLQVGQERVGLRDFLDKVPQTTRDIEVIGNVSRIAGLHDRTTAMVARNLKVYATPANVPKVRQARDAFLSKLRTDASTTRQQIVNWTLGRTSEYPTAASEYRGFGVGGVDILDYDSILSPGIQPNIQVQRQSIGQFIMGYTDAMVTQKVTDTYTRPTRRIYLNPDAEAAPDIFEKLLTTANAAGLSLQLKMYQRAPEFARAHKKAKGAMPLRGDGIVVYTSTEDANRMLGMALSIAEQNAAAFKGRVTSRVGQAVAEGIAVGDEPRRVGQGPLNRRTLTSHRSGIFAEAVAITRKARLIGNAARNLFRQSMRKACAANGVNPNNPAFNF